MGFDEILTTNFSYELEMAAQPDERVDDRRLAYMERHSGPGRPAETEYLLYTRNVLDWNGQERRVWHIHGEGRKPGSMILGHHFYANLLKKITNSLEGDWGRLAREQRLGRVPELRSWADAFILGDVYVLGFGYDVSEFDLWWLLNRKKKEEAETGETHFYAPEDSRLGEAVNEKEALLKVLGVRVHHCGARRPQGAPRTRSGGFREFYARAIEDIRRRMAENRETGGHTGPTA